MLARGERAWSANQAERAAGLPRIIPLARVHNGLRGNGPLETWPEYRRYLRSAGVRADSEPAVTITPGFCARGRSDRVP